MSRITMCHKVTGWGRIAAEGTKSQITLSGCIDSLMVMCNSHLMMKHSNLLAFIASHTSKSKFLFPKESKSEENIDEDLKGFPSDSKCEKFAEMNDMIVGEIKDLIADAEIPESADPNNPASALPSALCMALCCILFKPPSQY
ncbi:hypothetical protein QZH41_013269 [Actinostola sp. cb2023]|nr:hypothetical protein QZH41_013269 [Actinostola sp. cb2023]